jgi:hypothetical protein
MLTQNRLKELLELCLDTCIFTNRISRGADTVSNIAGYSGKDGYCVIQLDGKHYYAHRLIFLWKTGKFPKNQVDHINGIKNDNRWCNLREVNNTENQKNRSISKANTSGTTGVSWDKDRCKWKAQISIEGKRTNLGCFVGIEDAIKARKEAEIKNGYHNNQGENKKLF